MAVILPKSVFYHIPKTGGTWVREALNKSKIKSKYYNKQHSLHVPDEYKFAFKFSFVRHPADWYISRWRCPWHRQRIRQNKPSHIDAFTTAEQNDFNVWMERMLEEYPAFVTNQYKEYTECCDFVGKQENLVDDLIFALTKAGEEVKPEIIKKTKPNNVSKMDKPIYVSKIFDRVMESEWETIKEYNYDNVSRFKFIAPSIF